MSISQLLKSALLCAVMLFFLPLFLFAQRRITGTVIDKSGNAVKGATITEKGVNNSTATGDDGNFSLALRGNSNVITVTFVGFRRLEVPVAGKTTVAVTLTEEDAALSDVIVVGYQRQTVRKSTSSLQVVTSRQIENLPAPSFDQLLQGKVSGVNIQNFTGEPGVRNTFTIRGNSTIVTDLNSGVDEARTMSTPLYVIDGIPMSITDMESVGSTGNNLLAGISVNDIESIAVQKDASATAVWGSRGANGVVVIKTKKGRSAKPEVRVSYYKGLVERPRLLPTTIGAEERRQKMALIGEYSTYNQLASLPQIMTDSLNPAYNNATDWQDIFYSAGSIDNADISVSAATPSLNYRVGANYYNENGIVRNTGFSRYSLRGNFGFTITPKFDVALNFSLSRLGRKRGLGRGRNEVLPINTGQMPASFYALSDADKDFYYGQFDKIKDRNESDMMTLYLQSNYRVLPGLDYSFQGSVTRTTDVRERFQPSYIAADKRSFAENNTGTYESYYLANVLSYVRSLGTKHSINLVGTQSFQLDKRTRALLGGYNVPDDNITVVSGIPQADLYASSERKKAGLLSFVGQATYDYRQKYIASIAWRADASSRFGANSKWGYFPSASVAYILSDEPFLNRVKWISLLKLRASYGLSGTMPEDFYAPYNVWNLQQGTYNGVVVATPSFQNPLTQANLTWNKSNQANIGFDLNLFNNRVNITTDVYRRYNTNPILSFPFPFFTGYVRANYNAPVKILNEGVDVLVISHNLPRSSRVQWTTNLNFGYNRNRIAALPNGNRSFFGDSYGYNQLLVYSVGSPIYGWAQMQYQGVYNRLSEIPVNPFTGQRLTYFKTYNPVQPGYPKWVDVNKDWDVWSDEDRGEQYGDLVPTGDPNPRITGGFYNEVTYGGFSLGVQCTFTFGRDIINNFEAGQFANVWNYSSNTLNDFARFRTPDLSGRDYWSPAKADDAKNPGYEANFPSLNPFGGHFYEFLPFTTMWNESGDYLKIRSATLGYMVPEKVSSRAKLKRVRLYAVVDNIYSFQKSSVPDAELVSPQGEYRGASYPIPRKYTLGAEITF